MPESPDTPAVLLDYAGPARVSVRRWAWRVFLLGWAALTVYLVYDRESPWLRLQVPMLAEQRQCMRFTEPKDRVVFDSDPSRMKNLLGLGGYRVVMPRFSQVPSSAAVSTTADTRRAAFDDWQARLTKLDELQNFLAGSGGPNYPGGGLFAQWPDASPVVFMHRLSAGGHDRLMIIFADWYAQADLGNGVSGESVSLSAQAIVPASWVGRPKTISTTPILGRCQVFAAGPGRHLRLFAGQSDPADPSRFTIDYQTSEGRGTIEGKLRADDNVEMNILSGPALAGPPDPAAAATQPSADSRWAQPEFRGGDGAGS